MDNVLGSQSVITGTVLLHAHQVLTTMVLHVLLALLGRCGMELLVLPSQSLLCLPPRLPTILRLQPQPTHQLLPMVEPCLSAQLEQLGTSSNSDAFPAPPDAQSARPATPAQPAQLASPSTAPLVSAMRSVVMARDLCSPAMMATPSVEMDAAAPARSKVDSSALEAHLLLRTSAARTPLRLFLSAQADSPTNGERLCSTSESTTFPWP